MQSELALLVIILAITMQSELALLVSQIHVCECVLNNRNSGVKCHRFHVSSAVEYSIRVKSLTFEVSHLEEKGVCMP